MANDILQSVGSATDFTITLDSLAADAGRVSDQVTNTSPCAPKYLISAEITMGSTAPTDGTLIKFYLVRGDDGSTEIRDGDVGTTDSAISNLSRFEKTAQLVHSVAVEATASAVYKTSFVIEDPGTDWQIAVVNRTDQALDASGHTLRYRTLNDQIQ